MKVVALAGGVGGAKLAHGLALCLPPEDLTVIVNTGDDFEHLGLHISPDLDTVCYTLAGLANPETGWGLTGDSWEFLGALERLGGETWFRVGDQDLATHVERTRRLRAGESLSQVTQDFCRLWGVRPTVLPMTDDSVRTMVLTQDGELAFQDYFVRLACEPEVKGFRFEGAPSARPAPGVLESLAEAEAVVICPSNPWVSVDPILSVPGIRGTLAGSRVLAVSPIVGGEAIKGPAAQMFRQLGIEPTPLAVAGHYAGLISDMVIDQVDAPLAAGIELDGLRVLVTDTIMRTQADRHRLALETLAFVAQASQAAEVAI